MSEEDEKAMSDELPADSTIPPNLQLSAHNFRDEDYAKSALHRIHSILSAIGQYIDISGLDGVTVSFDYEGSLADLDRGYGGSYKLSPTKGVAVGVAMAPAVIRNGKVKTHLVINAQYALSLMEEAGYETEFFQQSLHLLAHECAHVEVTAAFDRCFPNIILQKQHTNILDNLRWQVISACWDEYAVCKITGSIGYDPTDGYLETFIAILRTTRTESFEIIKSYRTHADVGQAVAEVYGKLGDLMKFASYFLGAAVRQDTPNLKPPILLKEDEFAWFQPFYDRMIGAHEALDEQFGHWTDQGRFEVLGDILEEMAENIGIEATRMADDQIYFDIPYRLESMPLS